MGVNLMEMLKDAVGDQLTNQASAFLGESTENTSSAVGAIMPALLGGLLKKGSDQQGAQGILDFMSNANIDGSLLDNLGGMFGGGEKTNGLLTAGSGILDFVFGRNSSMLESVIDLISGQSGVKKSTSSSLMRMVSPLLMGVIGRYVKNKALDGLGLMNLLGGQKEHIQKAAPAGLFDKLGLGALGAIASQVTGSVKEVAADAASTGKAAAGVATAKVADAAASGRDAVQAGAATGSSLFSKILPWLILVAVALGLLWFMKGCGGQAGNAASGILDSTEEMADKAGEIAGSAVDATSNAANNAVDAAKNTIASISLPGGAEISATLGSFTDKIVKFLGGKSGDASTRFTFDGVNFATGSANLTSESMDQLQNLASIMKAYPDVKIRVEGHTDNTGDATANLSLSQQRSLAVKRTLNELGIANDRIAAVGKGQTEPIADNGTESGRLENRRVDVFVTNR